MTARKRPEDLSARNRPWSEREKQQVRDLYATMSQTEIARLLGRSRQSVGHCILRMGLTKPPQPPKPKLRKQAAPKLVAVGEAMPTIHADGRVRATRYRGTTMLPGSRVGLRAQWNQLAPAYVPPTVVPAKGKASGCDLRYQSPPDAEVWGCGFRAAGPGIDVTTGRAW